MGATRSKKDEPSGISPENCIEVKYKEIKQKMRKQAKTIKRLEMETNEYKNKLRLISKLSNSINHIQIQRE